MNFLKLNINKDDFSDDYLIIFDKFEKRPNKIIIHDTFAGDLFEDIVNAESEPNRLTEMIPVEDGYITNEKKLIEIKENIWCSFVIIDKESKSYIINDVCFYYKDEIDLEFINQIIDKLCNCIIDYEKESVNKFNTISITPNSLEIEPVYIDVDSLEIEGRYNDDIIKTVEKLQKKIKKTSKGLSIFSGDRGLGKTTMAKYLCSKVDRMTIFIPNTMVDLTINNPEFKNFIKKFEKVLLVIDDCEFLTNNQFSKISPFSNNLIQLLDGFLSDSLNLHILLIFNEYEEDIDENILDCNCLIDNVKFDELEADMATDLSKILGHNKKYKTPVRVVEVANNIKSDKIEKIGL